MAVQGFEGLCLSPLRVVLLAVSLAFQGFRGFRPALLATISVHFEILTTFQRSV